MLLVVLVQVGELAAISGARLRDTLAQVVDGLGQFRESGPDAEHEPRRNDHGKAETLQGAHDKLGDVARHGRGLHADNVNPGHLASPRDVRLDGFTHDGRNDRKLGDGLAARHERVHNG